VLMLPSLATRFDRLTASRGESGEKILHLFSPTRSKMVQELAPGTAAVVTRPR
jgi:hypothetical protein